MAIDRTDPDNAIHKFTEEFSATYPAPSIAWKPEPTIRLGHQGREAVIDFSGERVTFSGDLPVDEAAKIFFQAVGDLMADRMRNLPAAPLPQGNGR